MDLGGDLHVAVGRGRVSEDGQKIVTISSWVLAAYGMVHGGSGWHVLPCMGRWSPSVSLIHFSGLPAFQASNGTHLPRTLIPPATGDNVALMPVEVTALRLVLVFGDLDEAWRDPELILGSHYRSLNLSDLKAHVHCPSEGHADFPPSLPSSDPSLPPIFGVHTSSERGRHAHLSCINHLIKPKNHHTVLP